MSKEIRRTAYKICLAKLIIAGTALTLILSLMVGCFTERFLVLPDGGIQYVIYETNRLEISATEKTDGIKLQYSGFITENMITSNALVTIVKTTDTHTVIAAASGRQPFREGQTILVIEMADNNFSEDRLRSTTFSVPETASDPGFRVQVAVPIDGLFVLDSLVYTDGSFSEAGSFFIGGKNLHENRIQGIDILLEYDNEKLSITGIIPKDDEENMVEARRTWDESEGVIDLAMAFKRGHEKLIEGFEVLYRVDYETRITDPEFVGDIPVEITNAEVVAEDQILFEPPTRGGVVSIGSPLLLGDFNRDGTVDELDLIMLARVFDLSAEDDDYDPQYDIWPADDLYGDPWTGIFSWAEPDGEIDLEDLVIFAKNYDIDAPQYFVKTAEDLVRAVESVNNGIQIREIVIADDIDTTTLGNIELSELVNLRLNGKTVEGDLDIRTNATGEIIIHYGVIDGDLTIDAPNAIVHNYAEVTGDITELP